MAIETIEGSGLSESVVLHHDEADGLCSGALTKIALEKLGLTTRLICLDKLYPEVVRDIQSGPRQVVAYSDIGSAHIDWLSKNNKSNSVILTLDHHYTQREVPDFNVHNVNPWLDGFSGEKDASASTVAYMFAKTVDRKAASLAPLAMIGSNEIPGEPRGLNSIPLKDGEASGKVRRVGKGLKLDLNSASLSPSRASSILNVLGSVGYYRKGPETGIRACIDGFDKQTIALAKRLEEERKTANQRMLAMLRDGLSLMKNIQWFHARDNYMGMSGKVVGSFCSYLTYQRFINPAKYLVGMMNVSPEIPEWGRLPSPLVKVSGRAPTILAKLIETGKRPPLSEILPFACVRVGGFGDGHSVAASGVFPVSAYSWFLDELDRAGGIMISRDAAWSHPLGPSS